QVVDRSDDGVGVGEARGAVERPSHAVDERRRIRLVVDPQSTLFLHGLPLVVEVLVRDGERAHAVRLEPEREVQAVRGNRLVVVGTVFRRAAVLRAAGARHQLEVLALLHVSGAFEHHVLEQVREAGATGTLVARAGVVPHVHRHARRRMIFGVQDVQAVGQRERLVGDAAGLGRQRGSEPQQQSTQHAHTTHTAATHRSRPPLQDGNREPGHSGVGTTGPECTSSNANTPSSVSPFTTRRGAVRVAKIRKLPLLSGWTSNRPAGTRMVVGDSATKLRVVSESANSLYAGTPSESPGATLVTAPAMKT